MWGPPSICHLSAFPATFKDLGQYLSEVPSTLIPLPAQRGGGTDEEGVKPPGEPRAGKGAPRGQITFLKVKGLR